MANLLAFCLVLLAPSMVCSSLAASPQSDSSFSAFTAAYDKHYATLEEHTRRATIFAANVVLVERLNAEAAAMNTGVRFAINAFADLTQEEFRNLVLLPRRPAPPMPAAK